MAAQSPSTAFQADCFRASFGDCGRTDSFSKLVAVSTTTAAIAATVKGHTWIDRAFPY